MTSAFPNTDGTWLALGGLVALGLAITSTDAGRRALGALNESEGFVLGGDWQAQGQDGRWYDVRWSPADKAKLDALLASSVWTAWSTYLPVVEQDPGAVDAAFGDPEPWPDTGTFIGDVLNAITWGKGGIDDLAGVFTGRMGDDANKESFELGLFDQARELIVEQVEWLAQSITVSPQARTAIQGWLWTLKATSWS